MTPDILRSSPMPIYVPGYTEMRFGCGALIPHDATGRFKRELNTTDAESLLPFDGCTIVSTPTQRGAVYNSYVEHTLPWHQDQSLAANEARVIVGMAGAGPLCFSYQGATLIINLHAGDAVLWGFEAQHWAHGGYVGTRDSVAIRFAF